MKQMLVVVGVTFALIGATPHDSQAALITFDDVASGTLINTHYAGVTLGCFNGTLDPGDLCAGNAYALSSPTALSGANVIGLTSGVPLGTLTDERFGYFRATFGTAVNTVSIDAQAVLPLEHLGPTTNRPFLQAFASGGAFLGQAVYAGDVNLENWETLTFTSASNNIAFVAFSSFSSSGHPVYGQFDNLSFSSDTGGGGGPTPVPEPGSLLLLGMGLLGAARRLRRAQFPPAN